MLVSQPILALRLGRSRSNTTWTVVRRSHQRESIVNRSQVKSWKKRYPERANRNAIGILRLLLAGSVTVPVILFVVASWFYYQAALRDAEIDLQRISQVAREQAGKVFNSQTQIADRVNELVRDIDPAAIKRSESSLNEKFARLDEYFPEVQNVLLIDRTGHLLVSSAVYPVPENVDLSSRDYFQAVVEERAGSYVGSLQQGYLLNRLFFGIGRAWQASDGTLRGVIAVAVAPSFFEEFYRILLGEGRESAEGRVVTLVRDDGQILVQFPPVQGSPPRAPTSSPFLTAIQAKPDHGLFQSRSIAGSGPPDHLYSYSKVSDLPIYAVAGIDREVIMSDWRTTMASHLIFGVPSTIALFAITWTALVRTRREEQALERLHQEAGLREQAEATLLRAQRLEAVGQLTGGIAHDFNNLLTVVMSRAEMLQRRAGDPVKVQTIANQIILAVKRGSDITRQLLAFSRRQIVHPEIISPNARLRAFKPLLDQAAQEGIHVSLDLDSSTGWIQVDPGQFEAALLNLVGNARDAMPNGGEVFILTRNVSLIGDNELSPGRYIRVAVSDRGTGMDAQTAARAFEPFFTTKEVGKGTGLGLSQVYGFARQAGGDAKIRSELGQGTTIELIIPQVDDSHVPIAQPSPDCPADTPTGELVLVVEDEPSILETAVETLKDLGYRTITATSGAEALAALKELVSVDILFSDVIMPGGMDGVQLSIEAQRIRPGLKILLTSGYMGSQCKPSMGQSLIGKPYSKSKLSEQLRSLGDRPPAELQN